MLLLVRWNWRKDDGSERFELPQRRNQKLEQQKVSQLSLTKELSRNGEWRRLQLNCWKIQYLTTNLLPE
jgi:hypothetical protein